jgi:hypothetical protein
MKSTLPPSPRGGYRDTRMSGEGEDDADVEVEVFTRSRVRRPDRRKRGWTVVTGREIR